MLQIFQLEVDLGIYKPTVIRGIFQYGFSDVGTDPFFGGNDFCCNIQFFSI